MREEPAWLSLNKANWNDRVAHHVKSDFYGIEKFKEGGSTLSNGEINDLAPLNEKTLVHLQCHFGLDTLSFAREGASVTGVDFSDKAIAAAKKLAKETNLNAHFVVANVYDAPTTLKAQYDIVYTGIGALCWLPDIKEWAQCVAALLKQGGELYLNEFHPSAWMFEDDLTVQYSYFSPKDGEKILEENSYVGPNSPLNNKETRQWNHPLGAVITSLINAGLKITSLHETDECLMAYLPGMVRQENGLYKLPDTTPSPPLMYTLRACKS